MKIIAVLLVVALAFAIVVVFALYLVLRQINEDNRETCGKCDFCDDALQHCWMRGISVGTEDPACITFQKREEDEK